MVDISSGTGATSIFGSIFDAVSTLADLILISSLAFLVLETDSLSLQPINKRLVITVKAITSFRNILVVLFTF